MLINVLLLEADTAVANNLRQFWGSQNCIHVESTKQARRFIPENPATVLHIGPRVVMSHEVRSLLEDFMTDDSTLFVLINKDIDEISGHQDLPKDSITIPYIRLTRPSEDLDKVRDLLGRNLDFTDLLQLRRSLRDLALSTQP